MKKTDLMKEVRALSKKDARLRARQISEELMKLRFKAAVGQLDKPSIMRNLKRDLARVLTSVSSGEAK